MADRQAPRRDAAQEAVVADTKRRKIEREEKEAELVRKQEGCMCHGCEVCISIHSVKIFCVVRAVAAARLTAPSCIIERLPAAIREVQKSSRVQAGCNNIFCTWSATAVMEWSIADGTSMSSAASTSSLQRQAARAIMEGARKMLDSAGKDSRTRRPACRVTSLPPPPPPPPPDLRTALAARPITSEICRRQI